MDADLKKLKKLTRFMKKEGVLSVKLPNLELNLSPTVMFHEEQAPALESQTQSQPETSQYTEEEVLMWSAPGFAPEKEDLN